ncbi:Wzz/FepE/Etk N-terminal domain-containing protein [Alkalilimnicola sp. S0819]|uniref:Wzz/FepE/Etk N-terminal domain-containing protein n=1 Tax=Alkalilimnicola sp. S0819 TaxID=2613922 RepID=UPI0012627221|nr:Wzz/FepE/Etk N-terminal domain-containing protein [Alkalilimnicola sp. S0819]KAB7628230.1 hypothetical protein F3N43_00525 [Alkalilimnicola sp. S0819]MPQ15121.1 hypothetical protein [Alkalilimnicola sp. S0819]
MSSSQLSGASLPTEAGALPDNWNDNEISLFDLWEVLVCRRWWIIGALVVVLLAAGAYLFLVPPVYESRSVVQLSKVAGVPVVTLEVTAMGLREGYKVGDPDRPRPYLESVSKDESGGDALVITALGQSPDEAQAYLAMVARKLLEAQEQQFGSVLQIQRAAFNRVESQLSMLKQLLAAHQVAVVADGADEALRALLVLQSAGLQASLQSLEERRAELALSLSRQSTYSASIIREPTLPVRPVRPQPVLVLLIALGLGGALGVSIALFVEFLQKARLRSAARAAEGAGGRQ